MLPSSTFATSWSGAPEDDAVLDLRGQCLIFLSLLGHYSLPVERNKLALVEEGVASDEGSGAAPDPVEEAPPPGGRTRVPRGGLSVSSMKPMVV